MIYCPVSVWWEISGITWSPNWDSMKRLMNQGHLISADFPEGVLEAGLWTQLPVWGSIRYPASSRMNLVRAAFLAFHSTTYKTYRQYIHSHGMFCVHRSSWFSTPGVKGNYLSLEVYLIIWPNCNINLQREDWHVIIDYENSETN